MTNDPKATNDELREQERRGIFTKLTGHVATMAMFAYSSFCAAWDYQQAKIAEQAAVVKDLTVKLIALTICNDNCTREAVAREALEKYKATPCPSGAIRGEAAWPAHEALAALSSTNALNEIKRREWSEVAAFAERDRRCGVTGE